MKKTSLLVMFVLISAVAFATTAADRSTIVVTNLGSGWLGTNAGWEMDEKLIDSSSVLLYSKNSTNGPVRYFIKPDLNANVCEPDDDSAISGNDQCHAEIHSFWMTWDTNSIYFAVVGEAQNGLANIMIFVDRGTGEGADDFTSPGVVWNRAAYFNGMLVDFYFGYWCHDSGQRVGYGGFQLHKKDYGGSWEQVDYDQHGGDGVGETYSDLQAWYNGGDETDPSKRVLVVKIPWDLVTNDLPNVSDLTLKVAVATTGDGFSDNHAYDYCPDNMYGVYADRKSVENNFFVIQVISNGNILTNVSPVSNAYLSFIPGSVVYKPNQNFDLGVLSPSGEPTKAFSPNGDGINDYIDFSATINATAPLVDTKLKIYDLRGNLVRTLIDGALLSPDPTKEYTTFSGSTDSRFRWDGRDDAGNELPMGTYVVVFIAQDGNNVIFVKKPIALIK